MDIVAALGIPTSTAYKLLAEMRRVGMIEATNGRGRQRLTKRMTELGTIADRNAQKFASVEKYFDQLADELAETVYLVQLRGRLISLVGFSQPIETTGHTRVLPFRFTLLRPEKSFGHTKMKIF